MFEHSQHHCKIQFDHETMQPQFLLQFGKTTFKIVRDLIVDISTQFETDCTYASSLLYFLKSGM